jgi:hypothetical protein
VVSTHAPALWLVCLYRRKVNRSYPYVFIPSGQFHFCPDSHVAPLCVQHLRIVDKYSVSPPTTCVASYQFSTHLPHTNLTHIHNLLIQLPWRRFSESIGEPDCGISSSQLADPRYVLFLYTCPSLAPCHTYTHANAAQPPLPHASTRLSAKSRLIMCLTCPGRRNGIEQNRFVPHPPVIYARFVAWYANVYMIRSR